MCVACCDVLQEVWHEQLTHAFCLEHWQCAEVARLVLQWIQQLDTGSTQVADESADLSVVLGDENGALAAGSKEMPPAVQVARSLA